MKKSRIVRILMNPVFFGSSFFLLFALVAAYPYKSYDEGLWTYMGWLYNTHGISPYTGAIENKTPAIFLVYSLADNFGAYNVAFVRFLGVLFSVGTLSLVYKIGKEYLSKTIGFFASCVFGFLTCWFNVDGSLFGQTEVFMIFFSTLAFYFLLKIFFEELNYKWLFVVGLSLGMAINFKQIALTTVLGFLIILCTKKHKISEYVYRIVILGLGVLMSLLLCVLVLWVSGVSFMNYIEGAWLILLNSGSKVGGFDMHIANFFRTFFASRFLLFLPVIILFVRMRSKLSKQIFIILILWFLMDFLGVNASGYYYGHQIRQILPSLALITAVVIVSIMQSRLNKNTVLWLFLGVSLALFPYKQLMIVLKANYDAPSEAVVEASKTVDFIQNNSKHDDYIYVLGANSEIILMLPDFKRQSASKYFHSIFIVSEKEQQIVFKDLQQKQPKYIIKHRDFNDVHEIYGQEITELFQKEYQLAKSFSGIEIFEKN